MDFLIFKNPCNPSTPDSIPSDQPPTLHTATTKQNLNPVLPVSLQMNKMEQNRTAKGPDLICNCRKLLQRTSFQLGFGTSSTPGTTATAAAAAAGKLGPVGLQFLPDRIQSFCRKQPSTPLSSVRQPTVRCSTRNRLCSRLADSISSRRWFITGRWNQCASRQLPDQLAGAQSDTGRSNGRWHPSRNRQLSTKLVRTQPGCGDPTTAAGTRTAILVGTQSGGPRSPSGCSRQAAPSSEETRYLIEGKIPTASESRPAAHQSILLEKLARSCSPGRWWHPYGRTDRHQGGSRRNQERKTQQILLGLSNQDISHNLHSAMQIHWQLSTQIDKAMRTFNIILLFDTLMLLTYFLLCIPPNFFMLYILFTFFFCFF